MHRNTDELAELFVQHTGYNPTYIELLPASGSNRKYYRLWGQVSGEEKNNISIIGALSENLTESRTFIALTRHFADMGLAVPDLYCCNEIQSCYLQQDLGNRSLLEWVEQQRRQTEGGQWSTVLTDTYKKAIDRLLDFQLKGLQPGPHLNTLPQPLGRFDAQLALWDGHYFKYCFLKPLNAPFNEAALEADLQHLAHYAARVESNFFMLRDCQARNIMLRNNNPIEPYFIDYQGGMQGPLAYDLASLLYQAKAALPQDVRDQLLQYYIDSLQLRQPNIKTDIFKQQFYVFVLIRTLQVLGAYGFRGLFERKKHFIESIPYALDNVRFIRQAVKLPLELPELFRVLDHLAGRSDWPIGEEKMPSTPHHKPLALPELPENRAEQLTVKVQSFSYKRGIPTDRTGHGGGFVFDCRSLYNPGRYEPYKTLTGKDKAVQDFLTEKSHVATFLNHVYGLVDEAIAVYCARKLAYMTVNFGCTGGQHRSVYCAERLAKHLQTVFDATAVKVELHHIEQEQKV